MDFTKISQIKKSSISILIILAFSSFISYPTTKEKGLGVLFLSLLFVGILLWIITIFLLFLPQINEKRFLIAGIFMALDFELAFLTYVWCLWKTSFLRYLL